MFKAGTANSFCEAPGNAILSRPQVISVPSSLFLFLLFLENIEATASLRIMKQNTSCWQDPARGPAWEPLGEDGAGRHRWQVTSGALGFSETVQRSPGQQPRCQVQSAVRGSRVSPRNRGMERAERGLAGLGFLD